MKLLWHPIFDEYSSFNGRCRCVFFPRASQRYIEIKERQLCTHIYVYVNIRSQFLFVTSTAPTCIYVFFHIMQRTVKICVKRWRVKTRSALHRADNCTSTIDYTYCRSRFITTEIPKTILSLLENHELRCREGKPLR